MSAAELRSHLAGVGMARRNHHKRTVEIDRDLTAAVHRAKGEVPVAEIARLIGVDRSTVYRMLERASD